MKLINLIELQMGYSFRGRVDFDEKGGVSVVQMKDFDGAGRLDFTGLYRVEMSLKENHHAKRGDVIFKARGGSPSAAMICEDVGHLVVAAPLVRMRVRVSSGLMPEYLCWFLHQREAQVFFHARSEGTVLQMISVNTLADLELDLPALETQKQIIELAELLERERSLMSELMEKRENLMNEHLRQLAFNQIT